jgi:RNA polymerase sigma-70 factor (family 1)
MNLGKTIVQNSINFVVDNDNILSLSESEQYIKNAFQSNPDNGFTLLFKRYHSVLCNHAMRFIWDKEVVKDIVSDVFFNFWKNQDFDKISVSYRAYLFRAVRNACFNYVSRELNKTVSINDFTENSNSDFTPADQIIHFDELQHKIETAINSLPPQCRKVFILNRFEEKKYQQIADDLNISIKTVEMHISKALAHLREVLKNEWLLSLYFLIIATF